MSSYSGSSSAKPKAKLVKPILRKFTQSEKSSFDLNRPSTEQGLGLSASDYGTGSRSVHDVSFQSTRRGYHTRTTSGASQFSTATTGSGQRNGSFVHPFQQTPRPYTPPLTQSYQPSMLSEGERDEEQPRRGDDGNARPQTFRTTSNLSNRSTSFTETTTASPTLPELRIQTKNSSSSRLGLATGNSQPNLHSSFVTSPDLTSPADTMSPLSTMRTSMDKGFRLRSRSDVIIDPDNPSASRVDITKIQEAKRKYQEKERLKQEKAELAEVKAIERRNLKEARIVEKGGGRPSSKSFGSADGTRSRRSKSDLTAHEKGGEMYSGGTFMAQDYNSTLSGQAPPNMGDDEDFSRPTRRRTTVSNTKKKTHSAWTTFMIWLRTRFLRMGGSGRGK